MSESIRIDDLCVERLDWDVDERSVVVETSLSRTGSKGVLSGCLCMITDRICKEGMSRTSVNEAEKSRYAKRIVVEGGKITAGDYPSYKGAYGGDGQQVSSACGLEAACSLSLIGGGTWCSPAAGFAASRTFKPTLTCVLGGP